MEQLGIDVRLLTAQVVNFLIIVLVLHKLLYKPLLSMLAKRKKEIEEGLALTETMRKEEEKLVVKQEKVLSTARQEGQVIIEEAKKAAQDVGKEIIAASHRQAEEVIARARTEAERIHEQVGRDLRKEAVALAASMARRLVSSVLSPHDQHTLIGYHLKKLETIVKRTS